MTFVEWVTMLVDTPGWRQAAIVVGAVLVALLVRVLFTRVVLVFTRKTATEVDNQIVLAVRGPVVWSIILAGLAWAHLEIEAPPPVDYVVYGLILTVVGILWTVAAMRVGHILLDVLSRRVDEVPWIEPKTLPLFDMILKAVVVGGFLYIVCIAWDIPLTSWLTSAGIVGIAVGFAAKDTLANLFSGIFIIADAPYKIGDFVVLDNNIRGEVLEIGIRSTRLLTRDDVQVTVPNAVIGNAQIVNQTGGPHDKMRVRVKVSVAYGSDVDQVREVLLGCVEGVSNLCSDPVPRVRFREFGNSGLLFELLAWIDEPVFRGRVLDAMNTNVYKAFSGAGIEIPFAKQDVYVKELPRRE
ncbi:MAG: mechanosensitive ion channel family protein [Thermoanaerobaculales bacterium]